MGKDVLTVKHLSKDYVVKKHMFAPGKTIGAVNDVSFSVRENESLGLIGESGCGKTTIANAIMKIIAPSSGRIYACGADITDLSEEAMRVFRKDIQIVFQHSGMALDPKMTVSELLKEPLKIHRIVKKKEMDGEVGRLLEMVGIDPDERSKFPTQLSGGQNQRVIIARAMATRPRLIVCDEPVSALDVSVQCQILNLMARLKREQNLAYLFISHDINVVRFICDRIAVMIEGEIVEMGKADDIVHRPQHEYTKKLIASAFGLK